MLSSWAGLEGSLTRVRPYVEGFEVRVRNSSGFIRSPGYGEEFDYGHYETNRYHQVVVELPEDIQQLVGDGRLVVELEVDTREEEGWLEWVEFIEEPKYTLYKDDTLKMNWTESEKHCGREVEGGHLASILNSLESEEAVEVMEGKASPWGSTWIGANHLEQKKVWSWSDGSPWEYTNWYPCCMYGER